MRYRRLTAAGDMNFGSQQADFYRDTPEAVAQAVLTRLKLWLGEWFIDLTTGTPYQQAVLGKGTTQSVEPVLRARILETQGVEEIISFSYSFDPEQRSATVAAEINTIYGQTSITEVL